LEKSRPKCPVGRFGHAFSTLSEGRLSFHLQRRSFHPISYFVSEAVFCAKKSGKASVLVYFFLKKNPSAATTPTGIPRQIREFADARRQI
jgi:hypothetical protein